MNRFLTHIAFVVVALILVLSGLRVMPTGDAKTVVSVSGGTYVSGQMAIVPVQFPFPGWKLVKFTGSCGCMALESDHGLLILPTMISSENDQFVVKINTAGRVGNSYFSWRIDTERDGKT